MTAIVTTALLGLVGLAFGAGTTSGSWGTLLVISVAVVVYVMAAVSARKHPPRPKAAPRTSPPPYTGDPYLRPPND